MLDFRSLEDFGSLLFAKIESLAMKRGGAKILKESVDKLGANIKWIIGLFFPVIVGILAIIVKMFSDRSPISYFHL